MKKKLLGVLTVLFPGLLFTGSGKAQSFDLQQLLLDVQKLSALKTILSDMRQGYQDLDKDYSAVRDEVQGNFSLHKAYLDGLLAVNPAVRTYQHAIDIVNLQASLISRYQAAWSFFQKQSLLQPAELALIGRTFNGLLKDSLDDLGDLSKVLTDGTIRASDAERMRQIDAIYSSMAGRIALLDDFSNRNALLVAQRKSVFAEDQTVRNLHDINP